MRSVNVNKKGKTMKKTLKEKAAIFKTQAVMLKEQNVRLQNGMSNVSEQNKSLELEVEKLKSALVVKDLQKDLDHSEEKHKLKDEINNSQLYPKFTCTPQKDEGKVVT